MTYLNNLIYHFEEHVKRYKEYKKNIENEFKNKSVKDLIFFIEDKTFFGAMNLDNSPFQIILTKEFVDVWKNYPEVKYIFVAGDFKGKDYCIVYSYECTNDKYEAIYNMKILIMNSAVCVDFKEEVKWKK